MKTIILFVTLFSTMLGLYGTNYSVNFDINGLSQNVNTRGFDEFQLDKCNSIDDVGHPKLPVRILNYIIPVNMEVCEISASTTTSLLTETFNIMPVQTPEFENGDNDIFTNPDSVIYNNDAFYPEYSARIVSHSYMDGANHIVSIALYPVRCNPVSGKVEFLSNISFSFSFKASSRQPAYPKKHFAIDAPKYEAYLYNLIENKDEISSYRFVPDIEEAIMGNEYSYLIICPDDVVDLVDNEENPFADFILWKELKGHKVGLRTYSQIENAIVSCMGDDIGTFPIVDPPGKIRKYLKQQWEHHGLANVLIVGGMYDPKRYAHLMRAGDIPMSLKYPSDLYFAEFNGDWNNDDDLDSYYGEFQNPDLPDIGPSDQIDYLQEIFCGRLILPPENSPSRKQSIRNWSEKLITYEKGHGSGFVENSNSVYYVSASNITSEAYDTLVSNPIGFTGEMTTSTVSPSGLLRPSGATVIANINNLLPGITIIAAHGNKCRMRIADNYDEYDTIANSITSLDDYVHQSYTYEDEPNNGLDDLTNPNHLYSIMLAKSCNTGQYDYNMGDHEAPYPSMAEAYTSFLPNVGGPLWLGYTRIGSSGDNWDDSFVGNVFLSGVNQVYPNADPWNSGAAFAVARAAVLNKGSQHSMHFFGDPDMAIWSLNPQRLFMEVDSSSVCVVNEYGSALENIRVVFKNDTQVRIVYTDSSGLATTDIPFKYVCASKPNHLPCVIRIIRSHEIFDGSEHPFVLDNKVIVDPNASLSIYGNIILDYKGQIQVDGHLFIANNSVIQSLISSYDPIISSKIVVNKSFDCGSNVTFMAPNGRQWHGIELNNLTETGISNCIFNRTPVTINNSTVNFNSCEFSNSKVNSGGDGIDSNNINFNSCRFSISETGLSNANVYLCDSQIVDSALNFNMSAVNSNFCSYTNSVLNVEKGFLKMFADSTHVSTNQHVNEIRTLNSSAVIEACRFTRTSVHCDVIDVSLRNPSVYINDCQFNVGNIVLFGIPEYIVSNNKIYDAYAVYSSALMISYCGASGIHKVVNNIIEHSASIGIFIMGSYCSVADNNIIQYSQSHGIKSCSLSSWSLIGSNEQTYVHQIIRNNVGYQVVMTQNSIPDAIAYNWIQNNHHNVPWVFVSDTYHCHVDARNNHWGDDFQPRHDLYPPLSFDYEPTWLPGNIAIIEEVTAAALYRIGYNHELAEEYNEAIVTYKQLIEEFPDTEYAQLSAKALMRIECKKEYRLSGTSDFTALKTYYLNESNLRLSQDRAFIADCLVTKCNIKLQDYVSAICFYENVIDNPPSIIDSICAVIDLGYVYLLMSEGSKNSAYVGKKPEHKVKSIEEWRSRLSALLLIEDNAQANSGQIKPPYVLLSQNYPNPFNPSTTIAYSIPSEMPCKLDVYNLRGQKVRSLVNETVMAGNHSIVWNGKDDSGKSVSSGVYFYRLSTPNKIQTSKMLLMK